MRRCTEFFVSTKADISDDSELSELKSNAGDGQKGKQICAGYLRTSPKLKKLATMIAEHVCFASNESTRVPISPRFFRRLSATISRFIVSSFPAIESLRPFLFSSGGEDLLLEDRRKC